jgi:hypothetical protein
MNFLEFFTPRKVKLKTSARRFGFLRACEDLRWSRTLRGQSAALVVAGALREATNWRGAGTRISAPLLGLCPAQVARQTGRGSATGRLARGFIEAAARFDALRWIDSRTEDAVETSSVLFRPGRDRLFPRPHRRGDPRGEALALCRH